MKLSVCKTLLAFILILTAPVLEAREIWKIASLDWEPYSSSVMNNQGNSIQKLRDLLRGKGIELRVEFYPWSRARQIARDDGFIGYFPAWVEEVDEGFIPSPKVDESWVAVLKRPNDNLHYVDLNELFQKYQVGLISSYTYTPDIEQLAELYSENVLYTQSEMSLLKMLNAGRFNCAITDPYVMTYLAQKHGDHDVEIDKVLLKKGLVIALKNDVKVEKKILLLKELLQR